MGIILSSVYEIFTYPLPYGKKSASLADYPNLFSNNLLSFGILFFALYSLLCKKNNRNCEERNDEESELECFTAGCGVGRSEPELGSSCESQVSSDEDSTDDKSCGHNPQKSIHTIVNRSPKNTTFTRKHGRFRSKGRTKVRLDKRKHRISSNNLIHCGNVPCLFKRDYFDDNQNCDSGSDTDFSANDMRYMRSDSPPHTRSGKIYNGLSTNNVDNIL